MTPADRFASHCVTSPTGCVEWTGARNAFGYGVFLVCRTGALAHRVAWMAANGPIPPGACVCHRCDNRRCVNVAHLFLGTHGENLADMRAKGRHVPLRKGEAHHKAILKESDVRQIRALRAAGRSGASIAREFGVARGTVSGIVHRRFWKEVP